ARRRKSLHTRAAKLRKPAWNLFSTNAWCSATISESAGAEPHSKAHRHCQELPLFPRGSCMGVSGGQLETRTAVLSALGGCSSAVGYFSRAQSANCRKQCVGLRSRSHRSRQRWRQRVRRGLLV